MLLSKAVSDLFKYSKIPATRLNLNILYDYNKTNTIDVSISRSIFLHKELKVRLAHMVMVLGKLPYGLSDNINVTNVQDLYMDSFEKLRICPKPKCEDSIKNFTNLVENIKEQHNMVTEHMAVGVLEFKNTKYSSESTHTTINDFLHKFYKSRISIRTLIQHQVELERYKIGVISNSCNVLNVINDATKFCNEIVESTYDNTVNFEIKCDPALKFTYIPSHLYYICTEILKNAARATLDRYSEEELKNNYVKIDVIEGTDDIIIKITDNGYSFPRSKLKLVNSYLYTTAEMPDLTRKDLNSKLTIAGFGYGVPMSALHCELFGGKLVINPLDGTGTEVLIYIHKLGLTNETLE